MILSRENLIQMYVKGTLSAESQKEFDRLFQKDPLFTGQLTQALKEHLGPAPESWVGQTGSRLEQKRDSIWSIHEAQKAQSLLRIGQWFFVLTICGGLYLAAKWISTRENSKVPQVSALAPPSAPDSGISEDSSMPIRPPAFVSKSEKREKRSASGVESQTFPGNGDGLRRESSLPMDSGRLPGQSSQKNPDGPGTAQASPASSRSAANDFSSGGGSSQVVVGNKVRVFIDTLTTDHVKIKVIDSTGALIQNLYEGPWNPSRTVVWNGEDLAGQKVLAGNYFVVIQTATKTVSNKVSIKP